MGFWACEREGLDDGEEGIGTVANHVPNSDPRRVGGFGTLGRGGGGKGGEAAGRAGLYTLKAVGYETRRPARHPAGGRVARVSFLSTPRSRLGLACLGDFPFPLSWVGLCVA